MATMTGSDESTGTTRRETGGRRFHVNFSGEAFETLADLASRKGKTMSEVLRDAIALEKWFDQTQREGGRILVERDGRMHEVVKV
jgi:hypothetical protein